MCVTTLRGYGIDHSAAIGLQLGVMLGLCKAIKNFFNKRAHNAVASASGEISRVVKAVFFMWVCKVHINLRMHVIV